MDHLIAIQQQSGSVPPELEIPPAPVGSELILETFYQLHGARPAGGFGISAIPVSEIIAWQQAMNVRLTPWEIETILEIDKAAIHVLMEDK
jgi:hypothetical protein